MSLYTVAATQPWWRVLIATVACGTIWVVTGLAGGWSSVPAVFLQGIVVPAAIWWVGDGAKRLAESNRRLAEAGDALARRAVVEERLRIARELHDVVAHHLSVIAVQAGLARYVLRSGPATADTALGTVLDTGAQALDELRRLLEVLRVEAPAGDEPAPGLAYLPELLARVRAAGVPVEMTVTGTARELPIAYECRLITPGRPH